jgi:hypothetical protein
MQFASLHVPLVLCAFLMSVFRTMMCRKYLSRRSNTLNFSSAVRAGLVATASRSSRACIAAGFDRILLSNSGFGGGGAAVPNEKAGS